MVQTYSRRLNSFLETFLIVFCAERTYAESCCSPNASPILKYIYRENVFTIARTRALIESYIYFCLSKVDMNERKTFCFIDKTTASRIAS